MLTIFIHARLHALPQPTRPALISMRLVHLTTTVAFILANVLSVAANGAFEKASASFINKKYFFIKQNVIILNQKKKIQL
jgi:hypothetical protein